MTDRLEQAARALYLTRHPDDEHAEHSGHCAECLAEARAVLEQASAWMLKEWDWDGRTRLMRHQFRKDFGLDSPEAQGGEKS